MGWPGGRESGLEGGSDLGGIGDVEVGVGELETPLVGALDDLRPLGLDGSGENVEAHHVGAALY
jgi:hypothetical protein